MEIKLDFYVARHFKDSGNFAEGYRHDHDQFLQLEFLRKDLVFEEGDNNYIRGRIWKGHYYKYGADITGWTIKLIAKQNPTDSDVDAIIYRTVDTFKNPKEGKFLVDLTQSSGQNYTGNLLYQLIAITDKGKTQLLCEGFLSYRMNMFGEN